MHPICTCILVPGKLDKLMLFLPFSVIKHQKENSKVVITWSRLAGMKFSPTLPGSWQCCKLFINYILWLHIKCFIPARQDPSFVQPGYLCQDKIFPCNCFSPPRWDKKVNWKISLEVHFNRSKIFILCFYEDIYIMFFQSVRKKVNKYLFRISSF